jgi:hypothetical protein
MGRKNQANVDFRSPRPGLEDPLNRQPTVSPWATIGRASGAQIGRRISRPCLTGGFEHHELCDDHFPTCDGVRTICDGDFRLATTCGRFATAICRLATTFGRLATGCGRLATAFCHLRRPADDLRRPFFDLRRQKHRFFELSAGLRCVKSDSSPVLVTKLLQKRPCLRLSSAHNQLTSTDCLMGRELNSKQTYYGTKN